MLTLWQPWASLAFTCAKLHETRGWAVPSKMIGSEIVIHAAASPVREALITPLLDTICTAAFGENWRKTLPRGAALGTVCLAACERAEDVEGTWFDRECGDWTAGRFVWRLEGKTLWADPVPFKGKQGWGSFP